DPKPDDGYDRATAGAVHEYLPGRAGLHRRHVRTDHFGDACAQSHADRPLVGVSAVRLSTALQLHLSFRLHELPFRDRRGAVGALRLDRGSRAHLADTIHIGDRECGRAVLLSSLGAWHLRYRNILV